MKGANKNFIGGMMAILMLLIVSFGCNQHGTKLEFNKGELYYTDKITETEAKRFGEFLVKEGFFGEQEASAQLDKSGSTYQFRLVVKPGFDKDEEYVENTRTFAGELSKFFFNNAPVEVHLCDTNLKTLRVVRP